jgi:N utilization substance protein B
MTTEQKKQTKKPNRSGFRLSASRLAAVQALYEIEVAGAETKSVLNFFVNKHWREVTLQNPDAKPEEGNKARLTEPDPTYLANLVVGVVAEKGRIVKNLDDVLTGEWTAERLDVLMRMLLCTATFELIFEVDVPKRVIISEYTDLAHAFYEDNEAAFAAGILSSLTSKIRSK